MSVFNELIDNGFVAIRRNLFTHYEEGKINLCEYTIFTFILMLARRDGMVSVGPTWLHQIFKRDFNYDQCKKALASLAKKGYIACVKPSPKKGVSAVYLVDKFEIYEGGRIVERTNVKRLLSAATLPELSPNCSDGKPNQDFVIDLESIPYEDDLTDKAESLPVLSPSEPLEGSTLQQATSNKQQEHTNGGVGGTASNEPTPVGFARPERRSAKLGAHTRPARQPEDDQRWSMGELHDLRLSDDDFDPLDYAFGMATDEDESFRDIQRAVWYHWKVIPPNKRYWADPKQGRITSRVRLEFNLERMLERVPDDFEIPLWLYEQIPIHDLNCKLCGGIGSFPGIVNDVDYPAWMKMTCYEPCSCQCPHPYPWRLDPERMNNSPLEVSHAS